MGIAKGLIFRVRAVIAASQLYNCSVVVKCCRNLPPMDANGKADPFVKLQLLPDPTNIYKQKTEIQNKTRDPIFNEQFF